MFTAGAGRQSQTEVRVRQSVPLPGWESEVCLLMGHTDCCLLAGGGGRWLWKGGPIQAGAASEQLCLAEGRGGMA